MKCPFCNCNDTQVRDSRPDEDNAATRRRRVCSKCNARFTTMERVAIRVASVIKSDGRIEKFDREKVFRSLDIALRKRNISNETLETSTNKIVREIEKTGLSEVETKLIGASVMKLLKELDNVGYIRYASVYRNFREAKDFETIIGEVGKK